MSDFNSVLLSAAGVIVAITGLIVGAIQAWHGIDRFKATRNGGVPEVRQADAAERSAEAIEKSAKATEAMSSKLVEHIERIQVRETSVVKQAVTDDGDKTRAHADEHWEESERVDKEKVIYERGVADERNRRST